MEHNDSEGFKIEIDVAVDETWQLHSQPQRAGSLPTGKSPSPSLPNGMVIKTERDVPDNAIYPNELNTLRENAMKNQASDVRNNNHIIQNGHKDVTFEVNFKTEPVVDCEYDYDKTYESRNNNSGEMVNTNISHFNSATSRKLNISCGSTCSNDNVLACHENTQHIRKALTDNAGQTRIIETSDSVLQRETTSEQKEKITDRKQEDCSVNLENNETVQTNPDTNPDCNEQNKLFSCSKCMKSFQSISHLKRHELVHSDRRPLSCNLCKAGFKLQSHLKQHLLRHSGVRKYACDECDSKFFRIDHLRLHKQTHLGVRPHTCSVCNLSFGQAAHLKKHMIRHRDERTVFCKIKACRAVFHSVKEYSEHKKTHADDNKCKVCGVVVSRTDDLKKHMLIHDKIRPYSCDVCSATFIQAGHLSTHKLTHSDVMRFSCHLCGFKSKQACHLRRHMAVHEGQRPFTCKDCGASFMRNSGLTRHVRLCNAPQESTCM